MFLEMTSLKKRIKEAYKGPGLVVGRIEEKLIVCRSGFGWGFQIEEEMAPNKLKGALVEWIGDLPEPGEIARYQPGEVQMESGEFYDIFDNWKNARDYAARTPFLLAGRYGSGLVLMQSCQTREILPVMQIDMDMISPKEIDNNVESMPSLRPAFDGQAFYWKNENMIFFARMVRLKEEAQNTLLRKLDFLDCFSEGREARDWDMDTEEE